MTTMDNHNDNINSVDLFCDNWGLGAGQVLSTCECVKKNIYFFSFVNVFVGVATIHYGLYMGLL